MPQETQQFFYAFVKGPRGKLNLGSTPAANSKRFKPAVMPLMDVFLILCLNIPSNIDTELTGL